MKKEIPGAIRIKDGYAPAIITGAPGNYTAYVYEPQHNEFTKFEAMEWAINSITKIKKQWASESWVLFTNSSVETLGWFRNNGFIINGK